MTRPLSTSGNGSASDHVLIYDPYTAGHHLEYLSHLVRYEGNRETGRRLSLVVHPEFDERRPDLVADVRASENVDVHPLQSEEWGRIRGASTLLGQSVAEWNVVRTYGHDLQVDRCILMEMNVLQFAIGLPLQPVDFEVEGILFFPYVRIDCEGRSPLDWWACRLERLRKWGQTAWMLRNASLQTVYVLNDSVAARRLNRQFPKRKPFRALPDPIVRMQSAGEPEDCPADEKETGRMTLLMFGALREEKGVRLFIEALQGLDDDTASRLEARFVGEAQDPLAHDLSGLIDRLRASRPTLKVYHEDRFVSFGELEREIRRADVIVAPYTRTEGSSGVLGHAAQYRVPVLGPKTGLIGDLIESYQLGTTVAGPTPDALRRRIRQIVEAGRVACSEDGMHTYVAERSPERFVATLLE